MKPNIKHKNIRKRIISSVLVLMMTLVLGVPNAGRSIDTISSNKTILSLEHEDAELEKWAEIDATLEEIDLPSETRDININDSNETTGATEDVNENKIADEIESETSAENTEESANESADEKDVKDENESKEIDSDQNNGDEVSTNETTGSNSTKNDLKDDTTKQKEDASPSPNSISGFFWVDGNGDLDTDWDGHYNGNERPLVGYSVHLYLSDDLSIAVAATQTDNNGRYMFEDLAPGSYILGLKGEQIGGIDYLAPVFITSENKFAINWSVSGLPAYTELIELKDGQSAQDINAGLRLPMGTATYDVTITKGVLSKLADINKDGLITMFGEGEWIVVNTIGSGDDKTVMMMRKGNSRISRFSTGGSLEYSGSALQSFHRSYYNSLPTVGFKDLILVPELGNNHASEVVITTPKLPLTLAKSTTQTLDIVFSMSYRDAVDWNGGVTQPLRQAIRSTFGNTGSNAHMWLRTRAYNNQIWEFNNEVSTTAVGYIAPATNPNANILANPVVWVRAGGVWRYVNVHYIDATGKSIASSSMQKYQVLYDNGITLSKEEYPTIAGYKFDEIWRLDTSTSANKALPVEVLNIREDKNIYLVYSPVQTHQVTVDYIDIDTGKTISSQDTFTVNHGDTFKLDDIKKIDDYEYAYKWKDGITGLIRTDPVSIENITSDKAIYLYYNALKTTVDVTVTKRVVNGNDPTKEFEFRVLLVDLENKLEYEQIFNFKGGILDGSNVQPLPDGTIQANGSNELHFTLKHGQTITIKDVPNSCLITVSEETEDNKYDTTYSINGGVETSGTTTGSPMSIDRSGMTVDFVNTRVTGLTISKTLRNEVDMTKEFTFNVLLLGGGSSPLTDGQEFDYIGGVLDGSKAEAPPNGTLELEGVTLSSFSLKHGQTITIKGIPPGTTVIVSEVDPGADKYDTSYIVDGNSGGDGLSTGTLVMDDLDLTVDFTNKRKAIVPTGIHSGESAIVAFALAAIVLVAARQITIGYIQKRRTRNNHPTQ